MTKRPEAPKMDNLPTPTQPPLINPQELWTKNGGVMTGIDNAASNANGPNGEKKKKN